MPLLISRRTTFECNLLLLEVRSMIPGTQENGDQCYPRNEARKSVLLRPDGSDEDDECSNGAEEDTLHGSVVGYDLNLPVPKDGFFQMCTANCFDLCRRRRDHL
jgi:hypothetical protein